MREETIQRSVVATTVATNLQRDLGTITEDISKAMDRVEAEGSMFRQGEAALEKWRREQYVEQLVLLRGKSEEAVMTASNEKDRQAQFEVWFNALSQTQEMSKYQREMEAGLDSAKLALEQKKKMFDALRIQADLQAAKLGVMAQLVAAETSAEFNATQIQLTEKENQNGKAKQVSGAQAPFVGRSIVQRILRSSRNSRS